MTPPFPPPNARRRPRQCRGCSLRLASSGRQGAGLGTDQHSRPVDLRHTFDRMRPHCIDIGERGPRPIEMASKSARCGAIALARALSLPRQFNNTIGCRMRTCLHCAPVSTALAPLFSPAPSRSVPPLRICADADVTTTTTAAAHVLSLLRPLLTLRIPKHVSSTNRDIGRRARGVYAIVPHRFPTHTHVVPCCRPIRLVRTRQCCVAFVPPQAPWVV